MDISARGSAERNREKMYINRICLLLLVGLISFPDWSWDPIWRAFLAIAMWRELACLKTENSGFATAHVGAALYAVLLSLTALADATPVRVFLAAKMPLLTPVLTTAAIGLMFVGLYRGVNQARQAVGMTAASHVAIGLALVRPVILLLAVGGFTLVLWPLFVLAIYTLCLILLCRDTPAGLGGKGKSYFSPALSWAAVLVLLIYLALPHFSRLPVEARAFSPSSAGPNFKELLSKTGYDVDILDKLDSDDLARFEGAFGILSSRLVMGDDLLEVYVRDEELGYRVIYVAVMERPDPGDFRYANAISVAPETSVSRTVLVAKPKGKVVWSGKNGEMFEQKLDFVSSRDMGFKAKNTDAEQFVAQYALPEGYIADSTVIFFWEVAPTHPDLETKFDFNIFTSGRYEEKSYPYVSPIELIFERKSRHGWTVTSGPYVGDLLTKKYFS